MQKTKLGLSVGLVGAALYFFGLFSGYLVTGLLAAYVLLSEDNAWLRKQAVKAVAILVVFSFLGTAVNLIPNFLSFINSFVTLFGGNLPYGVVSNIVTVIQKLLNLAETVLLLVLGMMALAQGSMAVPVVDDIVEKNM